MALTGEEREERDPSAIQRELLQLEADIDALNLDELNTAFVMAKAHFDIAKLRLKLLTERRSALQSVLKSLSSI